MSLINTQEMIEGIEKNTASLINTMILRNRAAKTDSVGSSEKDTVINSVSIDAKENTTKLN